MQAGMGTSSIIGLSGFVQSLVGTALQSTGLLGGSASTSAASTQTQSDRGQLSPFAQLLSTLQQLQDSDTTQYQQVTQQIASNLKNAAQTASSDGNTTAATELNQLATDFTGASQNGQLPNIQDLAQAIGGHGHHHHGHGHAVSASESSDGNGNSTSSTTDASSSTPLQQILSAFQSNVQQNDSLNPMSIIMDTLASAGISIQS